MFSISNDIIPSFISRHNRAGSSAIKKIILRESYQMFVILRGFSRVKLQTFDNFRVKLFLIAREPALLCVNREERFIFKFIDFFFVCNCKSFHDFIFLHFAVYVLFLYCCYFLFCVVIYFAAFYLSQ